MSAKHQLTIESSLLKVITYLEKYLKSSKPDLVKSIVIIKKFLAEGIRFIF